LPVRWNLPRELQICSVILTFGVSVGDLRSEVEIRRISGDFQGGSEGWLRLETPP
jgi:hypothetical protein